MLKKKIIRANNYLHWSKVVNVFDDTGLYIIMKEMNSK